MNADRLLALYDQVAEAPDAVDRLRRFVLGLAVRGKLVEQCSTGEPASELLKRIAAETKNLKVGKKSRRTQHAALSNNFTFSVPSQWAWAKLGQISLRLHYGFTAPASKSQKEVRLLRITDIQNDRVDWSSVPGCEIDTNNFRNYALECGDLLIARTGGTIGKTFLVAEVPVKSVFASYLIRVQPARSLFPNYIKLFCGSDVYWDQLKAGSRGAGQPNVNGQTLGNMNVPLPPLAEQHRIVAKVDELTSLCDRLEANRNARESTRDRMTQASFVRLSAPDASDKTLRSHARFALDALPALTTRADQIKILRQTILDLAVHGELVEQDPERERPTSFSTSITHGEGGNVSLPANWCRPQLGEILDFRYGKGLKANQRKGDGPVPVYGSNGIRGYTTEPLTRRPCVIVGRKGSAGALNKCVGPSWTTDVAYYVEVPEFLNLHFLYISLSALNLASLAKGVKPGLSRSDVYNEYMSVPPLAEQLRIVAKVDTLMALCDGLEAGLSTVNSSRSHLLESVLRAAL